MSILKTLVSIVAPVYNEETVLPELLRRTVEAVRPLDDRYRFEFVWVDDGSRDNSLSVAKDLLTQDERLRVVELRRNYGQTAALQAALDQAEGEIIISMDADLQHFPEEIPAFLERIEEGYDVVCGWRHQRREGRVRRWPSRAANAMLRWISGLEIHDIGTTFRAYRKEIVRDLRLMGENHRFIPVFGRIAGARITEIPIENIERPVGKSNYGLGRTVSVFLDLFFLYFMTRYLDRPIRIFGKVAAVLGLASIVIGGVLLGMSLVTGIATVRDHSGWFFLAFFLMVASLQTILTGVLAEVVVRVYFSSVTPTTYNVRSVWRSGDT